MRNRTILEHLDPVDDEAVERAMGRPVFDELLDELVAKDGDAVRGSGGVTVPLLRRLPRRRRSLAAAAAGMAVLAGTLSGVTFLGSTSPLHGPLTTPWRAAIPLAPRAGAGAQSGTWQLVDAQLSGTWQLDVNGPPPGSLTCPVARACYVLSEHYASSMAGAAPLGESLYVSADAGATWSVLPMPTGFASTTSLSCGSATWCAVGGTYQGQPVLATTADGGHSFTIHPLPGGVGTLHALSCSAAESCGGLVAPSTIPRKTPEGAPVGATFLVTGDGGTTFTDEPIVQGDSMTTLACTSSLECVSVGSAEGAPRSPGTTAVGAVTTDGGRSWQPSHFPSGFGVHATSTQLSCTGADHCMLLGDVPVRMDNPPQCPSTPPQPMSVPARAPSTAPPSMSPTVQAISAAESALRTQANRVAASSAHSFGCGYPNTWTTVSDMATTTDGGRTWTPRPLPSNVPSPFLTGLACSTASDCWVAGQEEVAQTVGTGTDMASPVLLGTADGGGSWSKVTFSVPATAPNPTGQSYLNIGSVSCPSARVCVAGGAAVANATTAPVYRLVIPSGATGPGSGGSVGP